jgi:hypothetical protein
MQVLTSNYSSSESLKHVADGGTIAEEVISTVRTAQAFGTQHTLARKYDNHIAQARITDIRTALYNGMGLGTLFFVIYASYALSICRPLSTHQFPYDFCSVLLWNYADQSGAW